jgi:rRNA maturation endonuclease Nob1
MSFADKLKSRIATVRDEYKAEVEVREKRITICKSCPELFQPTDTCKKCGCFVNAKTWIKNTTCPLGKW